MGIAVLCTGIFGGSSRSCSATSPSAASTRPRAPSADGALAITGIVLGWIAIALTAVAAGAWLAYGISNL